MKTRMEDLNIIASSSEESLKNESNELLAKLQLLEEENTKLKNQLANPEEEKEGSGSTVKPKEITKPLTL